MRTMRCTATCPVLCELRPCSASESGLALLLGTDVMPGIRGRKSKSGQPVTIMEATVSDDEVDEMKKPKYSAEERQQQAAAAAAKAAAAAAMLPQDPKKMSAKQRRKLEKEAQEMEKEAKRAAVYASLAANKMNREHLRLLGSSSTIAQTASKRQLAERAAEAEKQGLELPALMNGKRSEPMETTDGTEAKRAKGLDESS